MLRFLYGCLLAWLTSSAAFAFYPGPQTAQASKTLASPTGTGTATAYIMMGLNQTITPAVSGRVQFTIVGDGYSGTIADGALVAIYYGTGTPPSNGAASSTANCGATTCAQAGVSVKYLVPTTASRNPFGNTAIVTGLTIGTAYWFDVAIESTVGAVTATVENISATAQEF